MSAIVDFGLGVFLGIIFYELLKMALDMHIDRKFEEMSK